MNKIGIYLHVPFCLRKCAYCDFYSLPQKEKIASFLPALFRQFALFQKRAKGFAADSVFVGGGTPSLLSPADWESLFSALRSRFSVEKDAEITAEMNPETLTADKLFAFLRGGGNRLSLGMQSANENELSLLGRGHRFFEVENAVKTARREGIQNLNLDLMYALPHQKLSDFRVSLEKALSLSPEHLSVYCLTVEEHTPIARLSAFLPEEEAQREMYLFAVEYLKQNGYRQYEISNFARPGFECRHNLKYWRRNPYLGFGPGAHSFFENRRFSCPPDLDSFLSRPDEDFFSACAPLLPGEEEEETIMLSLRLSEGIDLETLSPEKRAAVRKKLEFLIPLGLCRKTEKGFALTPEGFFVSNAILSDLI